MRPPRRGYVRTPCVGREIVGIAVPARAQKHRIGLMCLQLPRYQISRDDALSPPLIHHKIQHLMPRKHPDSPQSNLPTQRRVSPQKELLPRRSPCIESSRYLRPSERTIRQHSPILPRKRHPLGHTLVDDIDAYLCQPMYIRLPRAKISSLDRVVKQPVHRITVILIILGRINSTLGRNRVRPTRAILETEGFYPIPQLRQTCGSRGPCQTRPDHNHLVLPLVGGIHQTRIRLKPCPLVSQRTLRNSRIQLHGRIQPSITPTGMELNPTKSAKAKIHAPA